MKVEISVSAVLRIATGRAYADLESAESQKLPVILCSDNRKALREAIIGAFADIATRMLPHLKGVDVITDEDNDDIFHLTFADSEHFFPGADMLISQHLESMLAYTLLSQMHVSSPQKACERYASVVEQHAVELLSFLNRVETDISPCHIPPWHLI